MEIRIDPRDADYLWNTLRIKDNPRPDNTDEQWAGDDCYYTIHDYENIVIVAYYTVKDANAPMDSTKFADWDNPDYLVVDTSRRPL